MHKIEEELRDITRTKPRAKEPRGKFLERLILAVQDLADKDWDSLSTEAQKWVNDGAKAYKAGDPIIDFEPDAGGDDDDGDGDGEGAGDAPEDKPAKKSVGKKAKDDAAEAEADDKGKDKPAKKAAASKPAAETKAVGMKENIKLALIEDPTMSVDKIMESFPKGASLPSRFTVAGIRAEFRHSLKVLKKSGIKLNDIQI